MENIKYGGLKERDSGIAFSIKLINSHRTTGHLFSVFLPSPEGHTVLFTAISPAPEIVPGTDCAKTKCDG